MNLNEQTLFEAIESHSPCESWTKYYKNKIVKSGWTWLDILRSKKVHGIDKDWFFARLLGIAYTDVDVSHIGVKLYLDNFYRKTCCYDYDTFVAMVGTFIDSQEDRE